MKNTLYKSTNSLYEIPILIQTSEKLRLEAKDDYFNQARLNYINKQHPKFLDDYDFLLKSTEEIMNDFEDLREMNSILPTGFIFSVILNSDAYTMEELSHRAFLKASMRAIVLIFTDLNIQDLEATVLEADSYVEDDKINSSQIFDLVSKLDLDHSQKFSIIKYIDQIDLLYQRYCQAFDQINLVYRLFVDKYQYLIDDNLMKYKEPSSLKDWHVDRWVELDQFDSEDDNTSFMYSLVHYSGLVAKLSSHGVGNIIMKGVFADELEDLETVEDYDISIVHEQLLALGDTKRLKIFTAVQTRPYYAKELADHLNLAASTVSHHVDILSSAGLIKMTSKGKRIYYTINQKEIKDLAAYFTAIVQHKEEPEHEH